jgi:hypothetical protein
MRWMRISTALAAAAAVGLGLSGCISLFPVPVTQPGNPGDPIPVEEDPTAPGPEGWATLALCAGGPDDEWVWVPGFPTEEFEAAGLEPSCGASYLDQAPAYTSVADPAVTLDELEALAAALEATGYELTASSFEPVEPGDPSGLAGSWEYTRAGADPATIWIVNFAPGDDGPGSYYTYLDFESPATVALGR